MRVLLISPSNKFINEINILNKMFEAGLERYHLRKPGYERQQLIKYIGMVRPEFHSRIVLHSHYDLVNEYPLCGIHITESQKKNILEISSLLGIKLGGVGQVDISVSFHQLKELSEKNPGYSYAFLSPVFNSISKKGYKSIFDFHTIEKMLLKTEFNIFALGGCSAKNLRLLSELGFYGAAFLGAIWNDPDPFESFLIIQDYAKRLKWKN